jgi:antitoxin (DNA-binding transcriptional repressor) of toxin-antitoxin stability system
MVSGWSQNIGKYPQEILSVRLVQDARSGEEVVIRDRNLPVAKLVPLSAEDADDQELLLVAAGKMRLPKVRLDLKQLSKIPTGTVAGYKAIQALLADREEGL